MAASISHFVTAVTKFSCCSSNKKMYPLFFISRSKSLSPLCSLSFAGPPLNFFFFSMFLLLYIPNLWTWHWKIDWFVEDSWRFVKIRGRLIINLTWPRKASSFLFGYGKEYLPQRLGRTLDDVRESGTTSGFLCLNSAAQIMKMKDERTCFFLFNQRSKQEIKCLKAF